MCIYGSKSLMVNHHLNMFNAPCSNTTGGMKHLICHMTSENHVTEGSSIFMSGSFSWFVTTLLCLVAIGIAVVKMFLVYT